MTSEEIKARLQPWKQKLVRTAWLPQFDETASGSSAIASQFGGLPFLPSGASVPRCENCAAPLRLLLQLNLAELPEEASQRLGPGLLQAFYCESAECEQEEAGWEPLSDIHHARIVPAGAGEAAGTYGEPFPVKAITGWRATEDFPHAAEHADVGLEFEYRFDEKKVRVVCESLGFESPFVPLADLEPEQISSAQAGDKLFGWPYWVQGPEYPDCPKCRARMRHVFQIDSEQALPVMWGDMGVLTIFQCEKDRDVLTMSWACG